MSDNKKNSKPGDLLGFISLVEVAKDVFRGALLLTDRGGKPVDFRCTSAIKPNAIQRVLYGRSLMEHLSLDLCGVPLLQAVPEKPAVLLTDQPALLPLRGRCDLPILLLRRQADMASDSRESPAHEACALLASDTGIFDTVAVSGPAGEEVGLEQGIQGIRALAQSLDPMEPFSRIQAALKLVQEKAVTK